MVVNTKPILKDTKMDNKIPHEKERLSLLEDDDQESFQLCFEKHFHHETCEHPHSMGVQNEEVLDEDIPPDDFDGHPNPEEKSEVKKNRFRL